MSNVAINRETGEILVIGSDGQWQPAQRARNPETGQELYNNGSEWLPTPQPPQPPRGIGESLARGAGLAARALAPIGAGALAGGAMGAPFGGVGAIPGALAGATAAGLAQPISDLAVRGYNYLTGRQQPVPSQAMEQLMTAAGLPEPETASERLISTATRAGTEALTGAGTARQIAGIALPAVSTALPTQAAALAARGPASPVTRGVAETLAAAPGTQTAAAMSGATATQGLLEAGVPGAVALPLGVAASMLPTIRPSNIFPARNPGPRLENLEILRQAEVPLTPAQQLGNPTASVFESVMRYLPTTAPTVAKAEDATMRGWTRAVNRQFGLDSDIATPEVLTAYQRQWGQKADALEAATRLRPDKTFEDQVSNMRSQYTRGLDDGLYRSFDSQLRRVEDFIAARSQGAEIPGANYRLISSELNFAVDAGKRSGDPRIQEYGKAMERLRDSFSGLMQRSAASTPTQPPAGGPQLRGPQGQPLLAGPEGQGTPRDLAQEWKDLNRDYALFSRVREAMGSGTGKDKINTGFIPPKALEQAERASLGSDVFGMTQDPFTRLVRAGESILPNPTPNSGTAQRSMAQNMLTGAGNVVGSNQGRAWGAGQGALAFLEPVSSLGIPYVSSKMWFGRPIPPERQGLLGMRSLYGAMGAEE